MRWPVMLRATHEAIVGPLRSESHALRAMDDLWARQLRAANASYDALLDKYHALREQHHEIPPAPPAPASPAEPDAVAQAIVMSAGSNLQLRRALGRYASEQRILGMDEDAIAKQILVWEEDIEWEPSV